MHNQWWNFPKKHFLFQTLGKKLFYIHKFIAHKKKLLKICEYIGQICLKTRFDVHIHTRYSFAIFNKTVLTSTTAQKTVENGKALYIYICHFTNLILAWITNFRVSDTFKQFSISFFICSLLYTPLFVSFLLRRLTKKYPPLLFLGVYAICQIHCLVWTTLIL